MYLIWTLKRVVLTVFVERHLCALYLLSIYQAIGLPRTGNQD